MKARREAREESACGNCPLLVLASGTSLFCARCKASWTVSARAGPSSNPARNPARLHILHEPKLRAPFGKLTRQQRGFVNCRYERARTVGVSHQLSYKLAATTQQTDNLVGICSVHAHSGQVQRLPQNSRDELAPALVLPPPLSLQVLSQQL